MRISKIFNLNKSQVELDFIDIDPNKDIPLFIDPHFLANRTDNWSQEAVRTIRSFFQHLLRLLSANKENQARALFSYLGEPNETCLGLSRKKPQGRGVGPMDTDKMFESILKSRAIRTGLVEDLEDCVIFVDNLGRDKLSDMTTNLLRKHLTEYTRAQCNLWNIPMKTNVQGGHYWNRATTSWENAHTDMLVVRNQRLLLVPKGLVSYSDEYTPQKFHTHFQLTFLQGEHLRMNSVLVQKIPRKDGSIRTVVYKKDIKETESPGTKEDIEQFIEKHPDIFKAFKTTLSRPASSLENEEFSPTNVEEVIDHLITELSATAPGKENATKYHNLVLGILELLLYPDLICPEKEKEIHQGRKRIDITFDNAAQTGIFHELHKTHGFPCQYIFVECKNYSDDPNNPEVDQLAGRFSPNRGKVGLLVCREIKNPNILINRCIDTYKDEKGLILPLTDADLVEALHRKKEGHLRPLEKTLRDRRREVQVS